MKKLSLCQPSKTILLAAMILVGLALTSCCGSNQHSTNSKLSQSLASHLSSHSKERLEKIGNDGTVVVSIHHGPEPAPTIAKGSSRSLGFDPEIALLDLPTNLAVTLMGNSDQQTTVIWCAGQNIGKLDSMLRQSLLKLLKDKSWRTSSIRAIAVFDTPAQTLAEDLRNHGATIGSLTGNVATLSLLPESLFDLLDHPHLVKLSQPALQKPTQPHQRLKGES